MDFQLIYQKLEKMDEKLDKVGVDVAVLSERLTTHVETDTKKFDNIQPHIDILIADKIGQKKIKDRIGLYGKIVGLAAAIVGLIPVVSAFLSK